jgi:hypothetical protein
MNTCTVYVRAKDGHFILGHATAADSVFEAARASRQRRSQLCPFWQERKRLSASEIPEWCVRRAVLLRAAAVQFLFHRNP